MWRPVPHVAADKHTTGQAQYIDDLPRFKGEDKMLSFYLLKVELINAWTRRDEFGHRSGLCVTAEPFF